MSIQKCQCAKCDCLRDAQENICDECFDGSHYVLTALSQACKDGKHSWCLEVAYESKISTTKCVCECHKKT